MQKDQGKLTLEETIDTLKWAGVLEDEMAALERQLAPVAASSTAQKDGMRELGFVSAGVESQAGAICTAGEGRKVTANPDVLHTADEGRKVTANPDDIELLDESDAEDDSEERVEVAQKDVPAAVLWRFSKHSKHLIQSFVYVGLHASDQRFTFPAELFERSFYDFISKRSLKRSQKQNLQIFFLLSQKNDFQI